MSAHDRPKLWAWETREQAYARAFRIASITSNIILLDPDASFTPGVGFDWENESGQEQGDTQAG